METNLLTAYVDTDQDEVAKIIARYDLLALPIIDHQDMMVGIVTYDDANGCSSEEATEDFLKVGACNSLHLNSASNLPPFCNTKSVFWLVFFMFGSLLSGWDCSLEDVMALQQSLFWDSPFSSHFGWRLMWCLPPLVHLVFV